MDWKKALLAEDVDYRKTLFFATGAFVGSRSYPSCPSMPDFR